MNPVSEPDPWEAVTTADLIRTECESIAGMLIEKNSAYGDSALDPVRIFSTANPIEQIKVRIDDKLSRLSRGAATADEEDTVLDLVGYLVLLRVAGRRGIDAARTELGLPTLRDELGWPVEPVGETDRSPRVLAADTPEPPCGSVVLDCDNDSWRCCAAARWRWRGLAHGGWLSWASLASAHSPLTLIHEGTGQ